jgi:hypothetical protein
MVKKVFQYMIVILLGLVILNLIIEIHRSMNISLVNRIDPLKLLYTSVLGVLFGFLIEWRNCLKIFGGYIKINCLLLPSVILLIVSLLPITYKMIKLGILGTSYRVIPHGIFLAPLLNSTTIIIVNVLVGVLLVRSFVKA